MSIANPILLIAGLAALLVPLLIHLMRRRQQKKHVISSLYLFEQSLEVSKLPRRITNLPLLILRALAFTLIALSFAHPRQEGELDNARRGSIVYVLDGTASMNATEKAKPIWQRVQKIVKNELFQLDYTSLVSFVGSNLPESETLWHSPTAASNLVEKWKPGFGSRSVTDSIQQAANRLRDADPAALKTIHIISDLQRSSFLDLDQLKLPENVRLKISRVGGPWKKAANVSITGRPDGQGTIRRGIYQVSGGGQSRTVERSDAEAPVTADSGKSFSIPYAAAEPGWHSRILTVKAKDTFAWDDQFFDSFFVPSTAGIHLVEPYPDRAVFEQRSFFAARALAPGTAAIKEEEGKRLTNFSVKITPRINEASERVDILILPDLTSYSDSLQTRIQQICDDGGSVIFFGGPNISDREWNRLSRGIAPVTLYGSESVPEGVGLKWPAMTHPLWGRLGEYNRHKLRRLPLKTRHKLTPVNGAEVLSEYADGMPLVIERKTGKGSCLFVNTSIDRSWSDWPQQPDLYVPCLHLLVNYLLPLQTNQWADKTTRYSCSEKPVSVSIPGTLGGDSITIGKQTHQVSANGQIQGVLIDKPGLYPVKNASGNTLAILTGNLSPEESSEDFLSQEALASSLESQRFDAAGNEWLATFDVQSSGTHGIIKALLTALVLLLVIEPWIANRT